MRIIIIAQSRFGENLDTFLSIAYLLQNVGRTGKNIKRRTVAFIAASSFFFHDDDDTNQARLETQIP